jgi:hypothetical protein
MTPVDRQKLLVERTRKFNPAVYDTTINAGETQEFLFTYDGPGSEIEGHKIGCRSCTTVKREDNVLRVAFTAPPRSDYESQIAEGKKSSKYTSNITVYFNDGEPTQKYNEKRELTDNPDKVPISLQIRATIVF